MLTRCTKLMIADPMSVAMLLHAHLQTLVSKCMLFIVEL